MYRHIVEVQDNPSGVYASLTDFVPKCSLPLPPKRYVDPQHIKELCRLRSLCVCPATRKDYSFKIFKLRDAARKAWHKSLVQEAANGNWASRKLLQQRRPLQTAVRPLLDKHQGDRAAVAHSVQQHFQEKFSTPDDGDALEHYLHGLPDSECLFTPEEVIRAVGALKPNKTTGISRLSVSLLQHLVQAEFGLHLLCTMLNAFLTDLTMLPTCLATGWVILVPKKAFVHAPDQFRPIVCGEVMLKLLAKLAMTRIACQWPVPNCCFGACPGRGAAEALYTVKVCAQEAAGLQDDTIFLQLDISSAFDSLQLRAILQFFREKWSPNIAKSCRLLQWVLSHSVLRFQLFDSTWSLRQLVGTQQGASHSPILFGRIIAAKFDALCTLWEQHLESPAFRVGAKSLWGLWFVDDAICFFRNKAQFARLVPQLISMLADLGLTVNIAKSCSLSCSGPPRSLLCLRDLPHVVTSKYLGLQLRLAEGDDHMLQGFLRRTSCAFFSNRILLTAREATRPARLRMFQSLVTSSILWSLAVLSAHAVHLRALRVHHVTLLGWMLQCSPHFSWRDPTCIPCAQHAVKLWGRCYSTLWDQLLLEQQWKWVGHVLRMPPTSFVRNVLLNLSPSSRDAGSRRARTGPNNSGHRLLLRWLGHNGIDPSFASDRQAWNHLCNRWLARFDLCRNYFHHNTWHASPEAHLPQDFRAIQGCFHGQQVILVGCKPSGHWIFRELDRIEGWRQLSWQLSSDFEGFEAGLQQCLHAWCRNGTFHCRCLVHFLEVDDLFFWNSLPARLKAIESRSLVCEISSIPNQWMDQLMPELELMLTSG